MCQVRLCSSSHLTPHSSHSSYSSHSSHSSHTPSPSGSQPKPMVKGSGKCTTPLDSRMKATSLPCGKAAGQGRCTGGTARQGPTVDVAKCGRLAMATGHGAVRAGGLYCKYHVLPHCQGALLPHLQYAPVQQRCHQGLQRLPVDSQAIVRLYRAGQSRAVQGSTWTKGEHHRTQVSHHPMSLGSTQPPREAPGNGSQPMIPAHTQ